jgi:aryl-alcohol dehydrogenase-like predicted oxidoreductase
METIQWGDSGIRSSRIGLGTWAIGGWMWGGSDEAESIATIHTALERGITLIDTAPAYGEGRSEEIIGKALAQDGRRAQAVIATKAGISFKDGTPYRDSSPARLRQEVEDSLRRLRTDVIDLYQIHWPDPRTPLEDTARALEQLHQAGKIRAIGVSNFSLEQMDVFRSAAPLVAAQPPYNLFEREIEANVLPYAKTHGLVLLCYGALCRGLLSGRMRADTTFEGDDLRKVDPKFQPEHFPHYLAAVQALKTFAETRYGKSVLALAVRWVLAQGPTIALWGARHPGQLDPVTEIDGWQLDAAALAEIDAILAEHVPEPVSPAFMAPPL